MPSISPRFSLLYNRMKRLRVSFSITALQHRNCTSYARVYSYMANKRDHQGRVSMALVVTPLATRGVGIALLWTLCDSDGEGVDFSRVMFTGWRISSVAGPE